jgi:hypothetical protein
MLPKKGSQKSALGAGLPTPPPAAIENFLARWEPSAASERSNYQIFLTELCDLLDVPRPDPATDDAQQNRYTSS